MLQRYAFLVFWSRSVDCTISVTILISGRYPEHINFFNLLGFFENKILKDSAKF